MLFEKLRLLCARQEVLRLRAERDEYKRQLKYAMHANMRKRDELRLQATRRDSLIHLLNMGYV